MKIFVSVDMEGITGLPDHTFVTDYKHNYERARRIMTQEANAVIEAAFANGATEVVVNDSHSNMNNLLIGELHPDATLITGSKKPYSMVQSLDESYDGAIFIGYHSRAGTPGVMSHTMTLFIRNVYINDRVVGEIGMNAFKAGYHGVPVILLAGDQFACQEAKELIPDIETVTVKEAISRSSAKSLHPEKAQQLLKQHTTNAMKKLKSIKPLVPPENPIVKVEFNNYGQAEGAAYLPGSQLDPHAPIVEYHAKNMDEAYRAILVMANLASDVTYSG